MSQKKYWMYWTLTSLVVFIVFLLLFIFLRGTWLLSVGFIPFISLTYVVYQFGKTNSLPINTKEYWIITSLAMFLVLPVLLNVALILGGFFNAAVHEESPWFLLITLPLTLFPFALMTYAIYLFGKKATLPNTFLSRYGPFIVFIFFTLALWLLIVFVNDGDFFNRERIINTGLLAFLPTFLISFFCVTDPPTELWVYWIIPGSSIFAYLYSAVCFTIGTWRGKHFRTTENVKALPALAIILMLASIATVQGYMQQQSVMHPDTEHLELKDSSSTSGWGFTPFSEKNDLVTPKTPPSLQIDQDYPILDGAEALIPIYAAAANAIYQKNEKQDGRNDEDLRKKTVKFSYSTPAAYKSLLGGDVDMIFALAPSKEQAREATEKGITYTLTPIAREAFVFLVNEQNPVTSLNIEQIRDIYSGKINNWRKVGGTNGKIMAFQRNTGSGSQTAMVRNVMHETLMRAPLEAEYYDEMEGLIRGVSNYRNLGNAIGYSFRYYATVMNSVPGIRLLAIDGVAPTVENIRSGNYPFTEDFYIVTARPLSENASKLRDWFLSDEGQRLIEEVGYVPIMKDFH